MPWDDPRDRYKPGQYYQICDRSGFKMRSPTSKKEWNGRTVRESDWEPRPPQDLVRAKRVARHPEPASPEPTDTFITTTVTGDDL